MTKLGIKLKNSKIHDRLKEYIKIGKICSEELNKIIPEHTDPEVLKEVISFLRESGTTIIEEDSNSKNIKKESDIEFESSSENIMNSVSNDDPVRMYLKEMGYRILLTREGEVEVAKRIEESRKKKTIFFNTDADSSERDARLV